MREIEVRTSSGIFSLSVPCDDISIEEVLRMKRLPWSLFQGYISSSNNLRPVPLNINLKEINKDHKVIIQCLRNTSINQIIPSKSTVKKIGDAITTWQDSDSNDGTSSETVYEINDFLARQIVLEKVCEFMHQYSLARKVIVGISGGGDSNTLVRSLREYTERTGAQKEYLCFNLVYDPIWPNTAAKRASELCKENGIDLVTLDETDLQRILNMKTEFSKFYQHFHTHFGNDVGDSFLTFMVSLIGRHLCREHKTTEYCVGFNREDILSELIFCLINGYKPLSYPVRKFGSIHLLMPLWEVPKRILDACYPRYSFDNYQERITKSPLQRDVMYYISHILDETYPNLGLSLMKGCLHLFQNNWSELTHIPESDLYVSEYAHLDKLEEVKDFFKEYFTIPSS